MPCYILSLLFLASVSPAELSRRAFQIVQLKMTSDLSREGNLQDKQSSSLTLKPTYGEKGDIALYLQIRCHPVPLKSLLPFLVASMCSTVQSTHKKAEGFHYFVRVPKVLQVCSVLQRDAISSVKLSSLVHFVPRISFSGNNY